MCVCVFSLYSFSTSIFYFYTKTLGADNLESPVLGTSGHSSRPEFEGHGLWHPPLASFTRVVDLSVCQLMKACTDGASCGSGEPRDLTYSRWSKCRVLGSPHLRSLLTIC